MADLPARRRALGAGGRSLGVAILLAALRTDDDAGRRLRPDDP